MCELYVYQYAIKKKKKHTTVVQQYFSIFLDVEDIKTSLNIHYQIFQNTTRAEKHWGISDIWQTVKNNYSHYILICFVSLFQHVDGNIVDLLSLV